MTNENEEQPEEIKLQSKPVNFKENILMLVEARRIAEEIAGYQVMEKNYPSDLTLHMGKGQPLKTNPTLIRYIAKAEKAVIDQHIDDVLETVADMIQNDLDEIRELLK